jgi:hypothetical protein
MPSPSEPHQKGSLRIWTVTSRECSSSSGRGWARRLRTCSWTQRRQARRLGRLQCVSRRTTPALGQGQRRGKVPYGPAGRMRLIAAEGIRSDIAQHVRPIECGGPAELCRFLAARTEALLIFWAVCHLSHSVPADKSRPTRPRLAPEFPASPF